MKKYFRYKIKNLLMIQKIVTIHYLEFTKNFKTSGESHDFWELVYADKEDILCTAEGHEMLLHEGEMLFHKPNEFHALAANQKSAPNVFIISFECKSEAIDFFRDKKIKLDKSLLKFIYTIIEESKKTFDLPHSDPGLKKLIRLPNATLGGEQLIKNYLEILLINIMRSLTETASGNSTFLQRKESNNTLVNEIDHILKSNIYSDINIDELSKMTRYSKTYLFKKFKQSTGKTIMRYFIELKIEKAKQLLRENNLSVREISEKLAFDSPNYFSKTFKHITELTPSLYKKMHSV